MLPFILASMYIIIIYLTSNQNKTFFEQVSACFFSSSRTNGGQYVNVLS